MIQHRSTCAEIDLEAFRHNIRGIQKRISADSSILAIVKANAYGHGAVFCARTLEGCGVKRLGVATLEEGIELRNAGIRADIFVLGGLLTKTCQEFLDYRLRPVLHQLEDVERFGSLLKGSDKKYAVHIKMDTGMGRLGIFPEDSEKLIALLKKYSEIRVEGVLTHLARADEEDSEPSEQQFTKFAEVKKVFEKNGLQVPFYHIANSAAIIANRLEAGHWVRPGIMLYGAYPHPCQESKMDLKPLMTFKTGILGLKKFSEGSQLSYGGTFVTQRESLIAILPVGYADGYPRLVSNRGHVLVGGQKAPVVGRVCMDLTLIDVTDIPEVKVEDEVVLIGSQGNERIRAEEVAGWAETISYEIFCGISSRVPRIYKGL